jgi:hypothetical protein
MFQKYKKFDRKCKKNPKKFNNFLEREMFDL